MKNRLKYFFKTIKGSLTAKIIFGILFFMLSLGTVLITIAQKWFTDAVEDNYRKHLDRATKSLYTDFEDYMYDNDFNLDIHTEEYAEFYRMMSNTCLLQDLQYISVIQPIENYTKELFLFDVINVLDGPEQEFYYGYIQDIVSPEYSEAYRKIFEEKGSSVLIVRKGKGVKTPHISEMIPLHDKNTGEVIAVLETQHDGNESGDLGLQTPVLSGYAHHRGGLVPDLLAVSAPPVRTSAAADHCGSDPFRPGKAHV